MMAPVALARRYSCGSAARGSKMRAAVVIIGGRQCSTIRCNTDLATAEQWPAGSGASWGSKMRAVADCNCRSEAMSRCRKTDVESPAKGSVVGWATGGAAWGSKVNQPKCRTSYLPFLLPQISSIFQQNKLFFFLLLWKKQEQILVLVFSISIRY